MANYLRGNLFNGDTLVASNLHPALQKIWILENNTSNSSQKTGIMVGDGRFELVFVRGSGYQTIRGPKITSFHEGIYLGGQMDKPLDLNIFPNTKLIFVKIQPWAMGMLTGFHLREALNETVPFGEINNALKQKLDNFHPERDIQGILSTLNAAFEKGKIHQKNTQLIKKCCEILDAGYIDFRTAKDRYLNEVKMSSRTIEKLFERHIGISPQKYSNGMRLRGISEELHKNKPENSYSGLAYKYGFYDQAHFIRFFKNYWGVPPKKLPENKVFITDTEEHFRYYTI